MNHLSTFRLRPSQFIVSARHGKTEQLIAVTRLTKEEAAAAALALRAQGYVEIVTVMA